MLMPADSAAFATSATEKLARTRLRSFLSLTSTQSPAATWSTSGSEMPFFFTAEAAFESTYAARGPLPLPTLLEGTSTALTWKVFGGGPGGHGLPGLAAVAGGAGGAGCAGGGGGRGAPAGHRRLDVGSVRRREARQRLEIRGPASEHP